MGLAQFASLRWSSRRVRSVNTLPKATRLPDPRWWSLPELQPTLSGRDIAGLFRWLQQRQGWSQVDIGHLTGQSQPEVSGILKGRNVTSYDLLCRIADGLRIPRGRMGLSSCIACPDTGRTEGPDEGDDPVRRRDFLSAVGAVAAGGSTEGLERWFPDRGATLARVPDRVGAADVAQLREVTGQLRVLDKRYGGGAALDAARGFAGWAHGMLAADVTDAVGRDLRRALADLHGLVGWSMHDAGRQQLAKQHLMQALVLARQAGEPAFAADLIFQMGRVELHRRQPVEVLRLTGLGLVAAEEARCPSAVAMLYGNDAWAYAQLGDDRGVRSGLARAEEELARVEQPARWAPATNTFLEAGAYAAHCARVYGALAANAEHRRYAEAAVEQAQAALASGNGGRAWRSVVLDRIALAAAQLRAGNREIGFATAYEAADQAATLRSARATERLTDVADAAAAYEENADSRHLRMLVAARTGA